MHENLDKKLESTKIIFFKRKQLKVIKTFGSKPKSEQRFILTSIEAISVFGLHKYVA